MLSLQADAASGFVSAVVAEAAAETGSGVTGAATGQRRAAGWNIVEVERLLQQRMETASLPSRSRATCSREQIRLRTNGKRFVWTCISQSR